MEHQLLSRTPVILFSQLLLLGPLGCTTLGETTVPFVYESTTHDALRALSNAGPQGATTRLDQATPFDWDQVHFFPTGTKWQQVRETVGEDYAPGRTGRYLEPGPLLVFTQGSHRVSALSVIPPLHLSGSGVESHTPDTASVRVHSKPPAPHALVLEALRP